MKRILAFCCLYLILLPSCTGNKDASNIESLIKAWSQLSPNIIGGPSELKDAVEIIDISVKNIQESKFAELGCKDCKEAEAILTYKAVDKSTKTVFYELRKMDGEWEIVTTQLEGDKKEGCFPGINKEVIQSRKSLDIQK